MVRNGAWVVACLVTSLLLSACASPPNTEMDRAQGALDAARAAGAEQYATTELGAATTALKNAHDAVAARDYRLALNYALDSHEHAQNAARDTADAKARMRAEVERAMRDLGMLVADGQAQIAAATRAGVPRHLLTQPASAFEAASATLQKAGEATAGGDYLAASAALEGVKAGIEQARAVVDAAWKAPSVRRRR